MAVYSTNYPCSYIDEGCMSYTTTTTFADATYIQNELNRQYQRLMREIQKSTRYPYPPQTYIPPDKPKEAEKTVVEDKLKELIAHYYCR